MFQNMHVFYAMLQKYKVYKKIIAFQLSANFLLITINKTHNVLWFHSCNMYRLAYAMFYPVTTYCMSHAVT